jgi:hypothetical protein
MKVTSRDIEQLIAKVLAERQKSKPQPQSTLIDNLIQDEILRFTSLDEVGEEQPKSAEGQAPLNPDQFIDPARLDERKSVEHSGAPAGDAHLGTGASQHDVAAGNCAGR